ncbi:uncharacterized protein TNCV_1939431 [Trichonephila clavipes]|nr:uncharacterized protein TNCV_1939431 [Trichonephila clavipes]
METLKGYASVKDIYGKNTVAKYERIGHTQKRVGTKLRKLKSKRKDLGGRGKLTDAFIDKLQNYYSIAIRDNVNNLQGMQRAVIAAFFHCCSNAKQQIHGQCPVGPDSWCKCQEAVSKDKIYIDKSKGLPPNLNCNDDLRPGYEIPKEVVAKNIYLEFAYKLRLLKGYDLKVSYTRNYSFSEKGLDGVLKKVRWWKDFLCLDNEHIFGGDQGYTSEIMDEILTTARYLELEVDEDDTEKLIMGQEDEL